MRIGIVNDLPLAVEALRRSIVMGRRDRVIWVATSGEQAVDLCAQETPDLVLMDLILPGIDGVETTRRIMRATPCAILVVTVSVGTNSWRAFEAMGHGAIDAIDTPLLGTGDALVNVAPFLAKIDTIARLIGDPNSMAHPLKGERGPWLLRPDHGLVVIGASAGGPAALMTILGSLPQNFPAAIVVVQHIDGRFAAGLAQWLGGNSALPVRLAREGESPVSGTVLLAGTNDHLVLNGPARLGYHAEPSEYAYRPSVDVFFQSVSHLWLGDVVGVLLSGMGRDGAFGLKALRNKGHHTIAQDQATSAVYGMPKAAAALDAAVEVLPVQRIAPTLLALFTDSKL